MRTSVTEFGLYVERAFLNAHKHVEVSILRREQTHYIYGFDGRKNDRHAAQHRAPGVSERRFETLGQRVSYAPLRRAVAKKKKASLL